MCDYLYYYIKALYSGKDITEELSSTWAAPQKLSSLCDSGTSSILFSAYSLAAFRFNDGRSGLSQVGRSFEGTGEFKTNESPSTHYKIVSHLVNHIDL